MLILFPILYFTVIHSLPLILIKATSNYSIEFGFTCNYFIGYEIRAFTIKYVTNFGRCRNALRLKLEIFVAKFLAFSATYCHFSFDFDRTSSRPTLDFRMKIRYDSDHRTNFKITSIDRRAATSKQTVNL